MVGLQRKELGSVAIAVGLALLVWFAVEAFQEDWQGAGTPMWFAFIGAIVLNAIGTRLIRESNAKRSC